MVSNRTTRTVLAWTLAVAGSAAAVAWAQPAPGGAGGGGRGRERPPRQQAPTTLPAASVVIEVRGEYRYVTSNGLPDHVPGRFPNRNNPNAISPQEYHFRMPAAPVRAERRTAIRPSPFGVALNGVVFDPGTAEAWKDDPRSGWNIEAIPPKGVRSMNLGLDGSNAHVQPTGAYHYHATPEGLIERLLKDKNAKDGEVMLLVGWAADGFPIYDHHAFSDPNDASSPLKELKSSWRLRQGERPGGDRGPGGTFDGTYTQDYEFVPGSGDLDESNGRTGVTPEFPGGTYYYVLTSEFPYIPREWTGTPDPSFIRRPGEGRRRGRDGSGPGGPGGPGGPPPR